LAIVLPVGKLLACRIAASRLPSLPTERATEARGLLAPLFNQSSGGD
jgi:hypothetical protein